MEGDDDRCSICKCKSKKKEKALGSWLVTVMRPESRSDEV